MSGKVIAGAFGALILAASVCCSCTGHLYLQVKGDIGCERITIAEGELVEISYIHSVEKSLCREFFRVAPDGLVLTEMLTKSTGWGLPSTEVDFSFKEVDGERWLAYRMQRHVQCLLIRTDPINDYSIKAGTRVIRLGEVGRYVSIEVIGEAR